MTGNSAEPPVQRLAISVEQKPHQSRFTPIAATGPCGPALLCGLIFLFLFTTLGASGVAGVFLNKFLGIEDQVAKLEEENGVYEENNNVFKTQLEEQKEINKNLTRAYNQLQDEVDKLEVVATYINTTAVENNAKFDELLDELATSINSSRSTHDKLQAAAYTDIVKRVDCVIESIFAPFDFWKQGQGMGDNYPDVLKQTNKVLGDICHDPSDLESFLDNDSPARWGASVETPADMKIDQYLSEIQRYGTAMVSYYFDGSGIEWYMYDHDCDQLPGDKGFVWSLHKRKGIDYID